MASPQQIPTRAEATRVELERPNLLAAEASWYALQTLPRHEKKVATELRRKGIETFLPLFSEKHQWSDRQRIVEVPLFSQYVFVRTVNDPETRVAVLRTSGVTSFVGSKGLGVPIPDNQITAVQSVLESKLNASPCSYINIGSKVRIRGGSLDGVEGILLAFKGNQTLVISVELIQRSLAISVEGFRVEPV